MVSLSKVQEKAPTMVETYKQSLRAWGGFPLIGRVPVVVTVDRSGSMENRYRSGCVQQIVELALSTALVLDDDGIIPTSFFESSVTAEAEANINNITGFVHAQTKRLGWGSTNYAAAIDWIARHAPTGRPIAPLLALFVTDGAPDSEHQAECALRRTCALPCFIQFIGVGKDDFSFLRRLDNLPGRTIDNAGFYRADDITDTKSMIVAVGHEFPEYVKKARQAGLIQ